MDKIKEWFGNLDPDKKKTYVILGIGIGFIVFALTLYELRGGKREPVVAAEEKAKEVDSLSFLDKTDEQTSLKLAFDQKLKDLEKKREIARQKERETAGIDRVRAEKNLKNKIVQPNQVYEAFPKEKEIRKAQGGRNAAPNRNQKGINPFPSDNNGPAAVVETKIVSDISMISIDRSKSIKEQKKKESNAKKTYLPTGTILNGTLLTGVYAPTMSKGQKSPYPVVMRVTKNKDGSAFLPNEVRKDLSGCFLTGESYGSLSEERANIRLLRMSCLTSDRKKVIDMEVEGHVLAEGVVGVSGEVLSKQGKTLALAFVANFLAGIGEAFQAANTITSVTPIGGTISDVDPNKIAQYGAGSGFSKSFEMLAEFYMDILEETAPVIYVKGGRSIEMVLMKPIELKKDDFKWEGIKDDPDA